MTTNDDLVLCAAGALLAILSLFWLMYRRQRRLTVQLAALRAEAAIATARIEEMQHFAAEQAQSLTNAYAEREDVLADSRSLREKLRGLESARDDERYDERGDATRRF
jgi:hypothetical protein